MLFNPLLCMFFSECQKYPSTSKIDHFLIYSVYETMSLGLSQKKKKKKSKVQSFRVTHKLKYFKND